MADRVPTKDSEWRNRFYVWFVSMVAHRKKTDWLYANSLVPVLVGGQGIPLISRLLPEAVPLTSKLSHFGWEILVGERYMNSIGSIRALPDRSLIWLVSH